MAENESGNLIINDLPIEVMAENESGNLIINDLPIEVLSHIFTFLPYSDIKEIRYVCRLWYIASQDPCILDLEKVVCNNKNSSQVLLTLLESKRDFLHFRFESGFLFWNNEKFWSRFGPKVKSLTIYDCKVDDQGFLRVLSHCSKLKSLDIIESNLHFRPGAPIPNGSGKQYVMPKLRNLQSLKIAPIQDFNAVLFRRLFGSAPNLRTLSLNEIRGYGVLLREERYSIIVGNETLTFKEVLTHVGNNAHHPIDLCIGNLKKKHCEILAELLALPNLRLRRIQCDDDAILSDEIVPKAYLKPLQDVEPRNLDDEMLDFICNNLPDLKQLKVYCCPKVTSSVRMLSLLKNLTSLTLSGPTDVDETTFLQGMCSKVNRTLKSLVLHKIDSLPEKVIIELARTHPALIHLDLSSCKGTTDRSLQAIFKHQVSLKSLIVSYCDVTDAGLPATYISQMKNLQKLDVGFCRITGSSFERLKFPDIRQLNLRENRISEKPLEFLFENNRTIEELNLENCDGVTNKLLDVIVKKLLRLRRIDLTMSYKITEKGTKAIKSHCPCVRF